jgi:cyclophilin family peptidyl-prolyl cis-trans isomerase
MLRRLPPLLMVVCALLVGACGGDDDGGSQEATATPQAAATTEAGCRQVDPPQPKGEQDLRKPRLRLNPSKTWLATVATSCGTFAITLDVERAPKTASAFAALARQGFFDGLTFHRIVAGFVIQGGDPLGNGQGGPGFSVREAPPKDLAYTRGVVAMAKTGTEPAGTSGSQFFVVTAEDAQLPPDYALLGQVTEGQDVVDRIGAIPSDATTGQPSEPVVIDSIKVTGS